MKRTLAGGQMLRWRHLCLTVTPVKATMPAYLVGILALPCRGRTSATARRQRARILNACCRHLETHKGADAMRLGRLT